MRVKGHLGVDCGLKVGMVVFVVDGNLEWGVLG